MMAGGVPVGTSTPFHAGASKPGKPDSATVGKSGSDLLRLSVVTAIPRMRPACICGTAEGPTVNIICAWPAIKPVTPCATVL